MSAPKCCGKFMVAFGIAPYTVTSIYFQCQKCGRVKSVEEK